MKDIHEYPEALLDLVLQKDFEQLSATEKDYVSRWLDATEYQKLRKMQQDLPLVEKNIVHTIQPRPATKQQLLNALDGPAQPSAIRQMLDFRVPLWQAAASVILLIGLFWLSLHAQGTQKALTAGIIDTVKVVNTQLVHDTVYIEKQEQKTKKHTESLAYAPETHVQPADTYSATPSMPSLAGKVQVFSLDKKKDVENVGKSLGDDSVASRFGFFATM